MTQKEIISRLRKSIRHYAYCGRICEELKDLGFDTHMMEYYQQTDNGKAFGQMEILRDMTGKAPDEIYEAAEEEAIRDIREANYNTIKLLDLAGFNGKEYYEIQQKYA